MGGSSKPVRIGIEGVFYSLTHVPDLVCYGSKPAREIRANPQIRKEFEKKLRSFASASAYAPHQVYIGNLTPPELSKLPKPWYDHLLEGALPKGAFGDIVDQESFYGLLKEVDQFNLVALCERWFSDRMTKPADHKRLRLRSFAEIELLCREGALLNSLRLSPADVDYVISCSEEAVGDRYNRGGGNLAKAIAEEAGCENASGSDTKAFCAGPLYAIIHGASLIQSGVCERVAVVAGGSLAKLGMKFESHLKK